MGTKHRDFGTLNDATEGTAEDRTSDLHAPGFIATTDPETTYGTSDSSKPPGVQAGQLWIEESSADTFDTLWYRNSGNSAWIEIDLDVSYDDDEQLFFGTGNDYWFVYNSSGTQFELWTTDSDGGGSDGLVFDVADGADVLDFTSTPTVGGTNVVLETRTLTGGTNIDAIGDLSANRTIDLSDSIDLAGTLDVTGAVTLGTSVAIGGGQAISDSDNVALLDSTQTFTKNNVFERSDPGFASIQAQVTGDSTNRFQISAAGKMFWGPGSGGTDTILYRNAANELKTDDDFVVGGTLDVTGAVTMDSDATVGGQKLTVDSTATASGLYLTRPSDSTVRTAFTHDGTNDHLRIGGGAWSKFVFVGTGNVEMGGALDTTGAATLDTGANGSSFGGDLTVGGDLNINPTNTYTITNDATDRTFDANSTSTAELADVLATLLKDLGMDA